MPLSIRTKLPSLHPSSIFFSCIPTSAYKKKMVTKVSSTSPTHPQYFQETNPILSLFENCKSMDQLKQIHSLATRIGLASHPSVHSKIIAFCCLNEYGSMNYARHLLDIILEPNVFIWNTMIKGYFRVNCPKYAVSMFIEMLEKNVNPDSYTFPFLLKGLTSEFALQFGKVIHAHVCKFGFDSSLIAQNGLIYMYARCGQIDFSRGVFDMSSKTDVVTWNAMISGYNKIKLFHESRKLFKTMEKKGVLPTAVTLVLVISASAKLKDLDTGKCVHQFVINGRVETNLTLENALMDMYTACGEMDEALGIFQNMKRRDVISWTSIVTGFANSGQLHLARKYFDQMPERDSVSWTAMIDGYLRLNQFKEALMLFREMQIAKVKPDEFTIVSILTACAHLGALELGEWVKAYIDKTQAGYDVHVANALLDMYFKCGEVKKAMNIYDKMTCKDKFTWTSMIFGLAINGQGKEALEMLSDMLRTSIIPDEVTYIGILSACTHAGMIDEGRKFFYSMKMEHGLEPNVAHYGCMVDLLGRSGHLIEAYELIMNMPIKPNSVVWGALLGACRVHKNIEMAEKAAKQIIELEPENEAVYVLLSNIYAACNTVEKLSEVRRMMMERGIKKTPGCSSIEMNGIVHEFVAGDQSHPQSEEIYFKLEEMIEDLKFAGYLPDTSELALDIGEEERENALYRHSEKLAIAFGLISSKSGVTLRIVKNLRMCVDCHHVAKLVSRIYEREVIVRDKIRFHHFRNGLCTCNDYW